MPTPSLYRKFAMLLILITNPYSCSSSRPMPVSVKTESNTSTPITQTNDANHKEIENSLPEANPSSDKTATTGVTPSKKAMLFIGGSSGRIDTYLFDRATGAMTLLKSNPIAGSNPSFLAIDRTNKRLFAANESAVGSVQSYAIDFTTGQLTSLSEQSANGNGPTHVSLDAKGQWLLSANYNTGHVLSYPIDTSGRIGIAVSDQIAGQKAHEILLDASEGKAYVPCLGSNFIAQYAFSGATGMLSPLTPATVPAGTDGPRHFSTHPNRNWLYVLNEIGSSIQRFAIDEAGLLTLQGAAVSTLSVPTSGNTGAEIAVSTSGDFVYASNRGDDSIAILKVGVSGDLTLLKTVKTGGTRPRHFTIDSSGRWLVTANETSGQITLLAIDETKGDLTLVKDSPLTFASAQFVALVDIPD